MGGITGIGLQKTRKITCMIMIENNDFVGKTIDHNMAAYVIFHQHSCTKRGRFGRDRMIVGLTTTCAIGAYHF